MTFMGGGFRGNSVKAIKFPSGSRMFAAGNVESGTLVADVPLSFHSCRVSRHSSGCGKTRDATRAGRSGTRR
jgi:hypothetical protein